MREWVCGREAGESGDLRGSRACTSSNLIRASLLLHVVAAATLQLTAAAAAAAAVRAAAELLCLRCFYVDFSKENRSSGNAFMIPKIGAICQHGGRACFSVRISAGSSWATWPPFLSGTTTLEHLHSSTSHNSS